MSDATVLARPPASDDAKRLAEALANGAQLAPLHIEGLVLLAGEEAYAEVDVDAWRWVGTEVVYEHRSLVFGGPVMAAATALGSAAANRRRRLDAERAAAPQWRGLGVVRAVATDRRLLVWHDGAWWSLWFESVSAWHIEAAGRAVTVSLSDRAPYRLVGGGTQLLAVVILWLSTRPPLGAGHDTAFCV